MARKAFNLTPACYATDRQVEGMGLRAMEGASV